MGAVVMIELHAEAGEIPDVLLPEPVDQLLGSDSLVPGPHHDRRAMRVVGAEEDDVAAAQPPIAGPDIRLDVLDQMTDVDRPVGIGQTTGEQELFHRRSLSCVHASRLPLGICAVTTLVVPEVLTGARQRLNRKPAAEREWSPVATTTRPPGNPSSACEAGASTSTDSSRRTVRMERPAIDG